MWRFYVSAGASPGKVALRVRIADAPWRSRIADAPWHAVRLRDRVRSELKPRLAGQYLMALESPAVQTLSGLRPFAQE
jgi:hypothetical protein